MARLPEMNHADLNHAGAVVDKAIEYMVGQNIGSMAIASALLGGAVGLLARTLDDAAVVQVLSNAIAGVQSGELRRPEGGTGDGGSQGDYQSGPQSGREGGPDGHH